MRTYVCFLHCLPLQSGIVELLIRHTLDFTHMSVGSCIAHRSASRIKRVLATVHLLWNVHHLAVVVIVVVPSGLIGCLPRKEELYRLSNKVKAEVKVHHGISACFPLSLVHDHAVLLVRCFARCVPQHLRTRVDMVV